MNIKLSNIEKIQKAKASNQFRPYIDYIYFPYYKNLKPFTRIDFDFPVTVLIGANGTNKSSILKALEACCPKISLGNRWFSTHIDPIRHKPNVPCFVYGYDAVLDKEVEKAQVLISKYYRKGDPDYWEPAKSVAKYKMDPVPSDPAFAKKWGVNKQRWPKIPKNKPIYLTFRDSISAFDKFYYYGDAHPNKSDVKTRRSTIRRYSRSLNEVINKNLKSKKYRNKEKVFENRTLPTEALNYISHILNTSYQEIKLVRHTFYNCEGYTCKFKRNNIAYSEAFAGSGEFSVIRIVNEILNAGNYTLVLLDEPEVSLHPGAQEKLMEFILEQTLLKKLQVVIATHSPILIRNLPHNSIKVFINEPAQDTTSLLKQSCPPEEAFFHIGHHISNKVKIIVEDVLAHDLVQYAIEDLDEAVKSIIDIEYFSGGAFDIVNNFAISNAISNQNNVYILLDGDQNLGLTFKSFEEMADKEKLEIEDFLNAFIGANKNTLSIPKNSNETDELIKERNKKLYNYFKNNILFLPSNQNPEGFIWNKSNSPLKESISNNISCPKERFRLLTKEMLPQSTEISSKDILIFQLMLLKSIPKDDPDLKSIKESIERIAFLTRK